LCEEIKYKVDRYSINSIESVYLGGGTPGLLTPGQLEQIVNALDPLKFNKELEFTIEVNPKSANREKYSAMKDFKVNRISVGAQSFDDELLKKLGRIHTVDDIYSCINDICLAGIDNVSIDLMYGIPDQTFIHWKKTLDIALSLDLPHISTYGLKIEPETPFYEQYSPENPDLPADEITEKMFLMTDEMLVREGYEHYEISNYARNKAYSKHNLNYWQNNNYFGFGLSAHSFFEFIRCENTSSLEDYLKNPFQNNICHKISNAEYIEDAIFLNLRLASGIRLKEFSQKYHIDFMKHYKNIIEKYADFFTISSNHIALNLKGMLLSTNILAEFLK